MNKATKKLSSKESLNRVKDSSKSIEFVQILKESRNIEDTAVDIVYLFNISAYTHTYYNIYG